MKIYLLIIGSKVQAFASLSRLYKELGIEKDSIKKNLPFEHGRIRILEVEIDERV